MKKIFTTFIVVAMLLGLLPSTVVSAESATSGTTGDCKWKLEEMVLTISGNGAMDDYSGDNNSIVPAPWGKGFTEVIIEEGVTYIGEFAFFDNQYIEKVTISSTVQGIGQYAFYGCIAIETLICLSDIPAAEKIGLDNSSIKELTFGKNVASSDTIVAFGNNAMLEKLIISKDNPNFVLENGVVFSKNKKELVLYLDTNTGTSYTVPNGVEVIGASAFDKCANIQKVIIPNSVKIIGDAAFKYNRKLAEINLPDSLETIGTEAFLGTGISSIAIPDSVTSFGKGAFWYSAIEEITLGSGIKKIDDSTFCNTPLKSVVIPYGVESIGMGAFAICPRLVSITIPTTVTSISEMAFYECAALTDVYYPGSEDTKNNIVIGEGNDLLLNASWHYSSCEESHIYSNNCDKSCNVCGKTRTVGAHKYTNGCDTTCNYCNAKRTIKHTYSNSCDTSCNVCKATRSINHAYKTTTDKATLSKNGGIIKKCTVCGKVASKTAIKYAKTIKLSATAYTYNGKRKTPSVTVKDSAGKTLKKNTDYTVTYASGRKNVGAYKVTVKLVGKYKGTKTLTFKINPAKTTVSKLTAGKKSITVAITKKSTQITGYQIQYSTSKKFTSAKTKNVSSYKTTKYTIKKLGAKKTYYVRVRTYKTVGKTKYYSAWSAHKYIKTK